MRRACLVLLVAMSASLAPGQENKDSVDDLMQSAQQWADENLDDDALRLLQSADQEKVKQLFSDIQKRYHGEYVVDLAALKDTANAVLPLLERYEETADYAAWLRAQLDYLDVAGQFLVTIPPPKAEPGRVPQRAPNPAPEAEREIWVKRLSARPWPEAAKSYMPRLKPIFASQKIPPELVWIAEVESSFDPRARSPEGALGLFQLMPATAKRYGLRTGLFDERVKPEESARAAAKYLRYLHGHFKDWRLALAAYNVGEGAVQRVLDRHKVKTFDAIATQLPAETQMYVPRVEAVILRREGVKVGDW